VELVTTAGRHIYIDISNIVLLTKEPSADDILLTTHLHADHYIKSFQESFPGQQIFITAGRIELPDVTITSIASAHLPDQAITPEGASNYIFVIETGGLRIVHFGDIGQDALSAEQLAEIGPVDLAITQFNNSYSLMNADNLKGFNLMEQVKPRLIIPTHSDRATIEIAVARWKGYYSESRTVTITPANLPEERSILILGSQSLVSAYAGLFNLQEWK
jgi:L-ascorbate metabolism protein UlaG (beta-lactamase superfamily)